jgi:hypothetical protein
MAHGSKETKEQLLIIVKQKRTMLKDKITIRSCHPSLEKLGYAES